MAIKILSVDDEMDLELLFTQYFRRKIRKGEYEFFFAHNGLEALQVLLAHQDIDIVLSDINMPEMDGLTLLAKINEMRNPARKCIMVSAYGDMGNIRQAMNNGAFDFATKPIDLDDLQRSIDNAVAQIEYIHQSQKEHKTLEDLQGDLKAAREIQHAILPKNFNMNRFPDMDIHASMEAAKDVGGDFYDFFPIDDTRMGFVMADVSGKGVPAAMMMAVGRTMIKAIGSRGIASCECMKTVNNLLCKENTDFMFITTFYGIIDTVTGEVDYTNAGHNPQYVLHTDGRLSVLNPIGNIALGIMEDMDYKSSSTVLKPGEHIVMFTDGVTEAENSNYDQLGEEKLEACLKTLAGSGSKEIVESVNGLVKDFANGNPQNDDVTILVIGRK